MAEGEWPPHPTHRHRWIYIVFFLKMYHSSQRQALHQLRHVAAAAATAAPQTYSIPNAQNISCRH